MMVTSLFAWGTLRTRIVSSHPRVVTGICSCGIGKSTLKFTRRLLRRGRLKRATLTVRPSHSPVHCVVIRSRLTPGLLQQGLRFRDVCKLWRENRLPSWCFQ